MNACHPNIQETEAGNTEIAWDTVSKPSLTEREEQRSGHHLKDKKNPRNTYKAIIKDILLTDHQNLYYEFFHGAASE